MQVLTAAQPGCILWADSDHGGVTFAHPSPCSQPAPLGTSLQIKHGQTAYSQQTCCQAHTPVVSTSCACAGSGPLPEGIGHTVPTFQLSAAWDDVMPDAAGLASSEPPAASCAGRAQLPEDACYVLPTSGSSGAPKLVVGTAAGMCDCNCGCQGYAGHARV